MKNSNAGLFRRYALVEENMMRATMPRVSALDTETLNDRRRSRDDRALRVVRPLTFKLATAFNA